MEAPSGRAGGGAERREDGPKSTTKRGRPTAATCSHLVSVDKVEPPASTRVGPAAAEFLPEMPGIVSGPFGKVVHILPM